MTERRDFDTAAQTWDEKPQRVRLGREVAAAMAAALPLSREWDAMDFGCGTGLVTLNLSPLLGSMLGVDSSEKMVEQFNAKAAELGCSTVRAVRLDLEQGELPGGRYHLITCSMTMHHIPDIVPLLASLRSLLHPGGHVAITDLEAEDGSFHGDPVGVFHNGFEQEQFEQMLRQAGFTDISISTVTEIAKDGQVYPVFLATAITP
ncbi:class I SAM-dependent DNA methyltransferase [Pelobacter propionicus]|uniref:Methyltransferase type 12 n=1 Tax=Pelobacter propionicus (strain DSM 2379 / NBRC 103807 / OttBd1) TaxID=338966 RepID=A1AMC3_PELPD|nr:class I SAM-dependent methyltransferase [Pelobacter propionicus]ABK98493.1 Methyltransferase type 12 [Pelobacter propionicus DSM 2379]